MKPQAVKDAVNKYHVLSFTVTTAAATTTAVITAAALSALGVSKITDIHLKCTGDKAFLGLGVAASTTHGEDIIPVWKDTYFDFENCNYALLNVIRSGGTDVTVEGWVVVR